MAFVQMMDFKTAKIDEIQAMNREWEQATEGRRTLRRSVVARDRNDSSHHIVLAFFDSYDSAMANSQLPETSEFAERMNKLVDGSIGFHDFDVVEERT